MNQNDIKQWFVSNKKLYFASLEMTQNCNFRCKHCYCADKESKNLSLNDYITIIDKLHSTGCLFLNFTGGEIFTNRNFKEIYRYAKEKGFIIDLLTNISLLNDDIVKLFKELPPHSIAITIYGTNEAEYEAFTGAKENYYKVMDAMKLLKENNIHFVLRTVATRTLKDAVLKGRFEKIAEEFDTTFKYDPIVFPKTSGDISPLDECLTVGEIIQVESSTEVRKEAWIKAFANENEFKWTCQGGYSSLAIDFKGDAYICGLYRKKPISIIENDIEKVINHLKSVHEKHLEIVANNNCSKCKDRSVCKWCPAYSHIYNNNENEKVKFFCSLAAERRKAFVKNE